MSMDVARTEDGAVLKTLFDSEVRFAYAGRRIFDIGCRAHADAGQESRRRIGIHDVSAILTRDDGGWVGVAANSGGHRGRSWQPCSSANNRQ